MVTPPALISCTILKSMCRLSIARSPMSADEMALRTFVLMWSEIHGSFRHIGCMDHCPVRPVGNQSRPLTTVREQCPISLRRYDVKNGCVLQGPPVECRLERRVNGYRPRANRQNLSSLIKNFAKNSDSHAIGWTHECVFGCAAECQNGHCHFVSRQPP